MKLFNLRGNVASIEYRYLQVRNDPTKLGTFTTLYSEYKPVFRDFEDTLFVSAQYIHEAYMSRYVRKRYVRVDPVYFNIMKMCHALYCENPSENVITLRIVINIINDLDPRLISNLIKVHRQRIS
jgi:hypothetical protein